MKKSVLDYILKVRLPVTVFVIVMAFALTYYVSRPERDNLGYMPDQPINFSHKLHAGNMKIDCQYCHTAVEKGRHATIPSTDICMNCHTVARKNKPEIQKLTKFFEQNKPIPWKRVHRVPEFAYFNHSFHVNKGIDCKHCHGDVARMTKIAQVHSFTMGSCLKCHKDPYSRMPELKGVVNPGRIDCFACHR